MPVTVRALTDDDAERSHALRHEAFGNPRISGPSTLPGPGQQWLGAFDGDRLAARLAIRDYTSYFGGAVVPTAGISGVAVTPEYRGRGAFLPLVDRALAQAREAGYVVSSLFPTANGIYRRFGYELVAEQTVVTVPIAALGRLRLGDAERAVTLRRAEGPDMAAVRDCYTRWAREQNGPLTRSGPLFGGPPDPASDAQRASGPSGITLAERDGHLIGYASWTRSEGYGDFAHVRVDDLIADDAAATRSLLAMLGSFDAVAGELRLATSGQDVIRALLPSSHWPVTVRNPYLMRLLDVGRAFELRQWPDLTAECVWSVHDPQCLDNDGAWALTVAGGRAECRRTGPRREDQPTFSARGLAMAYAGAWSCDSIRRAGQLTGPTTADGLLNALLRERETHIRDYF